MSAQAPPLAQPQVPLPPVPGLGELDVTVRKGQDGSLGLNVRQAPLCLQVGRA